MEIALVDLKIINQKVYRRFLEPVGEKYNLNRAELDVLLFLANNPGYDTATDIVEYRGLVKSHVSTAVAKLEERGFLTRSFQNGNRRTVHLTLTEAAAPIVEEGRRGQQEYVKILHKGISDEEMDLLKSILKKIMMNAQETKED